MQKLSPNVLSKTRIGASLAWLSCTLGLCGLILWGLRPAAEAPILSILTGGSLERSTSQPSQMPAVISHQAAKDSGSRVLSPREEGLLQSYLSDRRSMQEAEGLVDVYFPELDAWHLRELKALKSEADREADAQYLSSGALLRDLRRLFIESHRQNSSTVAEYARTYALKALRRGLGESQEQGQEELEKLAFNILKQFPDTDDLAPDLINALKAERLQIYIILKQHAPERLGPAQWQELHPETQRLAQSYAADPARFRALEAIL